MTFITRLLPALVGTAFVGVAVVAPRQVVGQTLAKPDDPFFARFHPKTAPPVGAGAPSRGSAGDLR
jgi:hypothetical protein